MTTTNTNPRYYNRTLDARQLEREQAQLIYNAGKPKISVVMWMEVIGPSTPNGELLTMWDYAECLCRDYGIISPAKTLLKQVCELAVKDY